MKKRKQQPYSDTGIELKLEAALQDIPVKYVKQHEIAGLLNVDFYVPVANLIIECDGCYFHGCPTHYPNKWKPGKDYMRTQIMIGQGYRVLRLWEHDINELTIEQLKQKIALMI